MLLHFPQLAYSVECHQRPIASTPRNHCSCDQAARRRKAESNRGTPWHRLSATGGALTEGELGKLIKAARKGRHGQRDATLILLMARHGLRVTEAVDLRWDQIDFAKGHLHVKRLKGGLDSVRPIQGDELRALRELRREQEPPSAFVFTSERGGPMTRSNVSKMIEATGERAGSPAHAPTHLRPPPGGCRS